MNARRMASVLGIGPLTLLIGGTLIYGGLATMTSRNSSSSPQDAYAKVLAAYNCGGGCLQIRVRRYSSDWMNHLPAET